MLSIPLVPEFLEVEATVRHVTEGEVGVGFELLSTQDSQRLERLLEEERSDFEVVLSRRFAPGAKNLEWA